MMLSDTKEVQEACSEILNSDDESVRKIEQIEMSNNDDGQR